jgi:hypothetical protein
MGDLRPLGSERLAGMDKLRRIMEIAKYNEVPKQKLNDLSTTNYTIRLADGNLYGIVKEKSGYIIKKGLNESDLEYSEPMRNRKYYRSYSDAMKKLNLVVSEINRNEGNEFEIPLLGEQGKKKFVLKTNKKTPEGPAGDENLPAPDAGALPPAPEGEMPPAPDAGTLPPAPEGEMPPAPEGEMPPAPEGEMPPAPEGEMPPAPDEEMPPAPEGEEMPTMGDEEIPTMDDDEMGPSGLKMIQKLTGKLSQKIRAFDKDKGMDSQDIKYVINSIISAIDIKNLDDDDREEIVDKIEGFDEDYGMSDEGDFDLSDEDEMNMPDMGDMGDEGEMPPAPEGEEIPAPPVEEPKEGYQNVMDSIFSESKVEKVLSKYFNIKEDERPILENKKKVDYLQEKLNKIQQKKDLIEFSVSKKQEIKGLSLLEDYRNSTLVGKTNKGNLVLNINGKQVKVTPEGKTL